MNDLQGKKFGKLTAIEITTKPFNDVCKYIRKDGTVVKKPRVYNRRYWKCECDCGKSTEVDYYHLTCGTTKSCGCLHERKGKDSPFFRGCGEIPLDFFSVIRRSAKGGGKFNRIPKEFSITIRYIWELFLKQNRKCAISGLPLSFGGNAKECKFSSTSTRTASLDRIDSSKGYIEGNVQWIHKDINIMKNDTELSKFLNYCKIITENNR